ncbi:unnamed protein product [Nezara viridula]|uniref:Uncharacterized protein n=1 Tax=Nezara viridula TaxID=85310 RepID=A0A9P0GZ44_NEZVI|nr:unnamed protein product [Nezara viridula]
MKTHRRRSSEETRLTRRLPSRGGGSAAAASWRVLCRLPRRPLNIAPAAPAQCRLGGPHETTRSSSELGEDALALAATVGAPEVAAACGARAAVGRAVVTVSSPGYAPSPEKKRSVFPTAARSAVSARRSCMAGNAVDPRPGALIAAPCTPLPPPCRPPGPMHQPNEALSPPSPVTALISSRLSGGHVGEDIGNV